MRLRDDYVAECEHGVGRWNRVIERAGFGLRLRLPHVAFNRAIGEFAGLHVDPDGHIVPKDVWEARRDAMLPSADDGAYVAGLMRPEYEPARFACWIAPPKVGIDNKPGDFEYVKIEP